MCGIAGFLGKLTTPMPPDVLLKRMIRTIAHRGPDGQGFLYDDNIGLAHARLSIIDLAGGQQPMVSADGNVWISFNGEIFNYVELRHGLAECGLKFRTSSDTETILASYEHFGLDFISHLNGDFAFALWDQRLRRLVLARDRMGVRPLYYTISKDCLFFASAIKTLLSVPGISGELDPIALSQIFTLWCPLAPRTSFKGILELPPAHILIATPDRIEVRPYWQLEFPECDFRSDPRRDTALIDETRALLLDATRIRLRSDVPVGSYLSGGLDSSIITAMTQQLSTSDLKTFSVAFQEPELDETEHQQTMVAALGCDHRTVLCKSADVGRDFPTVISHTEQPVLRAAPAPLFALSKLVRQSGLKVVMTGEGADEVFAGYDIFKETKIRAFCARQPNSQIRPLLLRRLYPYLPRLQEQSQKYLEAFFGHGTNRIGDPLFSHLPRFRSAPGCGAFFSDDIQLQIRGYDPLEELRSRLPSDFARWHPLAQAQYLETTYLLPGYILSAQGDRMAMAHGVEGRFPFLDYRVLEFASRLPPHLKLRGLREKHILRESANALLPDEIAQRPKQPYRAPDSQSFTGPNAPAYVNDHLSPTAVESAGLFNPVAVAKIVQKADCRGLKSHRDNMSFVGILATQILHRQFVENGLQQSRRTPSLAETC